MRRSVAVAAAVLILAASACNRASAAGSPVGPATTATRGPAAGTYDQSLRVDGRVRTYRVEVPATVGGRLNSPVVVGLHGGGGSGQQFEAQTELTDQARQSGYIVVYSDGTGNTSLRTWNAGWCCGYARDHGVDDVHFLSVLIDRLVSDYRVDPRRVYLTGFSNGAMMTYRAGCELASKVTAIAVVSGAMDMDSCRPARALPVLILHGTDDTHVPYNGGQGSDSFPGSGPWDNRSVAYAVSFWTRRDSCPSMATTTTVGYVVKTTYSGCARGDEVTLYTINGGKHAWPGGPPPTRAGADQPMPKPDANRVISDFFLRFTG